MDTRHRRAVAVAGLISALILTVAAPGAAKQGQRVQRARYTGFTTTTASPFPFVFTQERLSGEGVGTAIGDPMAGEDRLSITVKDISGRPIAAWIYFLRPGVTDEYTTKLICSKTKRSLAINPRYAVLVAPAAGDCSGELSIPSRGDVTFRFSN